MADFDISSDPEVSAQQIESVLSAILRLIVSLPRKTPAEGYKGRVTPLKVLPLVIGIGEDGSYKVADVREYLDSVPDIVWHDWLRLYGSDFDPAGTRPPGGGGKIGAADVLRLLVGGATGGAGPVLSDIVRRLISR